jgi:predicted SprT family Zn-dependent metalloprotease
VTEAHAVELFTRLRKELGLPDGWKFGFDNSRKRYGVCRGMRDRFTRKDIMERGEISISRHLMALNSDHETEQTMRHEIAHALAGCSHGHDWVWKQMAIKCGDDGRRCYDKSVVTPKGAWEAKCPACGNVFKRQRPMKPGRECWCRCMGYRTKECALTYSPTFVGTTPNAPTKFVSPEVAKVLAMRASGMGFVAIDAAHGIIGKRGWWSWKIVKENS